MISLIQNPSRISEAAGLLVEDIRNAPLLINKKYYQRKHSFPETDFLQEDWDNLILLDACRYDIFREEASFEDTEIESRRSPASASLGFMNHHYIGKEHHDTVYVTSNPHVESIPSGTFHHIVNLLGSDWDEDSETVLPSVVVDKAIETAERFPNKRLIIHFMQPHFPFIGETGEKISSGFGQTLSERESPHPWKEQMLNSRYNRETLIQAYRENHRLVVPHVRNLLQSIDGKSVITSDHANLIGEKGYPIPIQMYGHPTRFPHPNLLTVPWVEIEGNRRTIQSEPPIQYEQLDEGTVQSRLESLGYR
ncbi:hypothetical protein [Halostagnicola sp. A56]|uniref:hypothetical protein n=1 Tax=Halostagnicola sp. A56 TaxID=1495067 RepID=UPI0012E24A8A|nr:hypothetical protein [Halostagnicola sp. A56]